MSLPIFISGDKNLTLLQTNWAKQINPILVSPLNNGIFLTTINLIMGDTLINHKLGQLQQGWIITDINGAASIYRSQPFNSQTLTLNSTAAVTVNLFVY